MIVTVKIDDDGKVSERTMDLARWPAMTHELRLLATVMESSNLAAAFIHLVTVGIDVCIQEYGREQLKRRKSEFIDLMGI